MNVVAHVVVGVIGWYMSCFVLVDVLFGILFDLFFFLTCCVVN